MNVNQLSKVIMLFHAKSTCIIAESSVGTQKKLYSPKRIDVFWYIKFQDIFLSSPLSAVKLCYVSMPNEAGFFFRFRILVL